MTSAQAAAANSADPAPVLFVLADRWTSAMLHADMLERGIDGACLPSVVAALFTDVTDYGSGVVVAEHERLSERDRAALAWLRALGLVRATVLVTGVFAATPVATWDVVFKRPVRAAELLRSVEALARALPAAVAVPATFRGHDVRVADPWPTVRCSTCGAARHCEAPRAATEDARARRHLAAFGVVHEARRCA